MTMLCFDCSKADASLIDRIADRALCDYPDQGPKHDLVMDLTACHCNGTPLDLRKLLKASEADFGHDVFGIRKYLNRRTGDMKDGFSPRCARR